MGAQWLSGRVLDSRLRGRGFEPHRHHCVVVLERHIYPSLVLVQPRKTCPCLTERLLMGRKESNQTKLADNQDWHNILCFLISSWSLFQVQSYLPFSIINYFQMLKGSLPCSQWWDLPLLLANPRRQVFTRRGPYYDICSLLHEIFIYPSRSPQPSRLNPISKAKFSLSVTNPKDRSYRVVGKISKTIGRDSKMNNETPFSTMYICSQLVRF